MGTHNLALTKNGEVYVWGSNSYGQLGIIDDSFNEGDDDDDDDDNDNFGINTMEEFQQKDHNVNYYYDNIEKTARITWIPKKLDQIDYNIYECLDISTGLGHTLALLLKKK